MRAVADVHERRITAFEDAVGSTRTRPTKIQISGEGGGLPRWSRDGGTLYYLGAVDAWLKAADLEISGRSLKVVRVRDVADVTGVGGARFVWDVAPDGRYLVNMAELRNLPSEISVVQNWTNLLKK